MKNAVFPFAAFNNWNSGHKAARRKEQGRQLIRRLFRSRPGLQRWVGSVRGMRGQPGTVACPTSQVKLWLDNLGDFFFKKWEGAWYTQNIFLASNKDIIWYKLSWMLEVLELEKS